jgi:glutamate synthase domain-containing protein 2/glutamate synthase domain-containing protein 1/glutamate synthase domain-containing protein 3
MQSLVSGESRGGCGILGIVNLSQSPQHQLVQQGLLGIENMEHRGGSVGGNGDGAGLLLRPSKEFFKRFVSPCFRIDDEHETLIVGTIFFECSQRVVEENRPIFEALIRQAGLVTLGWRIPPVNLDVLGADARAKCPLIMQVLIARGNRPEAHLPKVLHDLKVALESRFRNLLMVASLNLHATVYKILGTARQLRLFYRDFSDPEFTTQLLIGHRRFSTNTLPNWHLVQPFRMLAHNGEINTITANCRAIRSVEGAIDTGHILMEGGSDSAQFDRVLEMMSTHGMKNVAEAMRRLISPPWEEETRDAREVSFFEGNRRALGTLAAWEGPSGLLATDGRLLVGCVDRMGLRPLRYWITAKNYFYIASEMGAVPIRKEDIICDGQLEPGCMIVADRETGAVQFPKEAEQWVIDNTGLNFAGLASRDLLPLEAHGNSDNLSIHVLNTFGWSREHRLFVEKMAQTGSEAVISMGNDLPLAVFSKNNSRLYSYLNQIVAVVTNPPIDMHREGGAMDLTLYLGRSPRVTVKSTYDSWPQYKIQGPVLSNAEIATLLGNEIPGLSACRIDATFEDNSDWRTLVNRVHAVTEEAIELLRREKVSILVLSDRNVEQGRLPLPMLLVVSALHRRLAELGLRRDASIVVETGEVHEGHDLAVLLAYGATAVNPYALFYIGEKTKGVAKEVAERNLIKALTDAIKRVMAKMGITSLAGYRGSALFEALGISADVVDYFIPDTRSRIGGITLQHIYEDVAARSLRGDSLLAGNENQSIFRRDVITALQEVARSGNEQGGYDRFVEMLHRPTSPCYLRDLLDFRWASAVTDDADVAPRDEIVRSTFRGAAMSHGALHIVAHRAIASAFNHFGALSNSGEGGEDERREVGEVWERDRNRIRQVASGRFGVDAKYLLGADEIEIKIGQGAKPGEGGHLPGHKVTVQIARIRRTKVGTELISPPPHHDIYSIEDLAQMIFNLRELHPTSVIGVKVPSVANIGTIAVGIAKAGADVISVSGFEGGTGAALRSSVFHAGSPLEIGVAAVHQNLCSSALRQQIRVRADGGMKSGLDVAKILALGADEVAFGTTLLIAENCVYCRGCSFGKCPAGIAVQGDHDDFALPQVEQRYQESRQAVIRYLSCVAEHVRSILGKLGLNHPRELVGRVDLLQQLETQNDRWDSVNLSEILKNAAGWIPAQSSYAGLRRDVGSKNREIVNAAFPVLSGHRNEIEIDLELDNRDRAIAATLAGKIAQSRGYSGLVTLKTFGVAGQAYGFCATSGMRLFHRGYANDSVAEGMAGSALVVVVPEKTASHGEHHLVGNAAGYGATGGKLYVAGRSGQRFGVRNSGGVLVCEGTGKYAFEYMTGGTGVVLGTVGYCLGAGMTGGRLFVWDPDEAISRRVSRELVSRIRKLDESDKTELRKILVDFAENTQSSKAISLLLDWEKTQRQCVLLA